MSHHIGPRTISALGGSIKRVGNYRVHTFPSEIVTDGLILNLDPGDPNSYPSQGLTWTDLSGMGNNGTMTANNTPTYQTVNGGIFNFDGSNDYVTTSLPSNAIAEGDANSEYTLEAWIYVESSQGGDTNSDAIMGHTTSYGVGMQVGTSSSLARVNYGSRSTSNFYGNTFNYQEWRHVVLTRDGINGPIAYENGVEVSRTGNTTDLDIEPGQTIGDFNVGYCGPRIAGYFHGRMGPVRVYNRALSAAEVAQNYDALKVRYTTYTNTFTPICAGSEGKVEVLCVAGGGGGGRQHAGGGGGAGGLVYNTGFSLTNSTAVSLTVGQGGLGGVQSGQVMTNGGNSTFSTITATGGGKGGEENSPQNGTAGGSGGGGSGHSGATTGGAGTSGQGNAGGGGGTPSADATYGQGGGGGGAGGVGGDGPEGINNAPGNGGAGLAYDISGELRFYAGGGGGGSWDTTTGNANPGGLGGSGVGGKGGAGAVNHGFRGQNGVPNTGSGGGGSAGSAGPRNGGNGSNGIVIVRYPATDYNVEVLVVGGGGGGGNDTGGGGGAGGLIYNSSYPVSAGKKLQVTVGKGGPRASTSSVNATAGGNSVFNNQIAIGGGYGSSNSSLSPGGNGGSGGGGGAYSQYQGVGGTGVSGQGNNGGTATASGAGGGGGAATAGGSGDTNVIPSGYGGDGLSYSITGSSVVYAAGGGGGQNQSNSSGIGGSSGVGGDGGTGSRNPTDPNANTGSGGAGGANTNQPNGNRRGTNGADGIVIIAYKGPQMGIGGTIDTTSRPGYTLHKFTTAGTDFFIP